MPPTPDDDENGGGGEDGDDDEALNMEPSRTFDSKASFGPMFGPLKKEPGPERVAPESINQSARVGPARRLLNAIPILQLVCDPPSNRSHNYSEGRPLWRGSN